MRFQIDDSYMRQVYTKNDKFIDFPLKDLDLREHCDPNAKLDNCKYDLYGVIHHTGSVDAGHYYATIKNDIDSEEWFMFNGKSTRFRLSVCVNNLTFTVIQPFIAAIICSK